MLNSLNTKCSFPPNVIFISRHGFKLTRSSLHQKTASHHFLTVSPYKMKNTIIWVQQSGHSTIKLYDKLHIYFNVTTAYPSPTENLKVPDYFQGARNYSRKNFSVFIHHRRFFLLLSLCATHSMLLNVFLYNEFPFLWLLNGVSSFLNAATH